MMEESEEKSHDQASMQPYEIKNMEDGASDNEDTKIQSSSNSDDSERGSECSKGSSSTSGEMSTEKDIESEESGETDHFQKEQNEELHRLMELIEEIDPNMKSEWQELGVSSMKLEHSEENFDAAATEALLHRSATLMKRLHQENEYRKRIIEQIRTENMERMPLRPDNIAPVGIVSEDGHYSASTSENMSCRTSGTGSSNITGSSDLTDWRRESRSNNPRSQSMEHTNASSESGSNTSVQDINNKN